ncbi:MAG: hypothetical protein Solumvirus5_13 [Solumvirus sp.]|uniref:Uncharacterized protein n=1 Tax=Solumvirus sp. TaxID=2487773 RepID=A0A3G5AGJ0_9VIRU|nr:MAG: hypothetical protein Solumvirus5_13 [Solumvirus sp.]
MTQRPTPPNVDQQTSSSSVTNTPQNPKVSAKPPNTGFATPAHAAEVAIAASRNPVIATSASKTQLPIYPMSTVTQPISPPLPVSTAHIGPLPSPKTVTITFVPDFNQTELRSPLRPTSFRVLLGPEGTTPETAKWSFEFNMYAMDPITGPSKKPDEKPIPKDARALLWFGGKPYATYSHCVVPKGCKLSMMDELKTTSITIRPHHETKIPDSLIYVRRRPGASKSHAIGYIKVVQGYHYYLNITFAAGSNIAQLVGSQGWRPIVYLTTKRPGREETDYITGVREFTNLVTNWAQGVEVNPSDQEIKEALDALVQDVTDEEITKLLKHNTTLSSVNTPQFPPGIHQPVNHTPQNMVTTQPFPTINQQRDLVFGPALNPISQGLVSNAATQNNNVQHMMISSNPQSTPPESKNNSAGTTVPARISSLESQNPPDLEWALRNKDPQTIKLPPLDILGFKRINSHRHSHARRATLGIELPFSLDPVVENFIDPVETPFVLLLQMLEGTMRKISLEPTNPGNTTAKHFLSFLSAINQLMGWQHVQRFIDNPKLYQENSVASLRGVEKSQDSLSNNAFQPSSATNTTQELSSITRGSMDALQVKAQTLLSSIIKRIQWFSGLQNKQHPTFKDRLKDNTVMISSVVLYIRLIAADHDWKSDVDAFMKESESKIIDMLTTHTATFQAFRDLQRKGLNGLIHQNFVV